MSMSEIKKGGADFVGYEYKEITVAAAKASLLLDGYASFGWHKSEHFPLEKSAGSVTLHLRRDRKILNKMELTRLQRNFEASMETLAALERSKTAKPQAIAWTAGVIGTVFMAGSTFAVTAAPPLIGLCVLLAIPGLIGWAAPYFLYQTLVKKRTTLVTPLIEQKQDEIYELCKKGSELLYD